jgi:hypothetical protein
MAWMIYSSLSARFPSIDPKDPDAFKELDRYFEGTGYRVNWRSGDVISPELVPKDMKMVKGQRPVDWQSVHGAPLVSQRFRDAVESIDPGRHQFFPVSVEGRNGAPVKGRFYLFNIVGQIDSILAEKSNLKPVGQGFIVRWGYTREVGPWQCALDSHVIGGRAFWAEYRYTRCSFVSDEMARILADQKLVGFEFLDHCDEIDGATATTASSCATATATAASTIYPRCSVAATPGSVT